MVEMENVSAGYGKCKVLHNINLKLLKGQVTTLVGVNGSGKSTLLKTLLGFLPLSDGKIRIDGIPMENFSRVELARKIAYLPQGNSVPDITAGRMVLHGRFPYLSYPRKYRAQDIAIAEQAMPAVVAITSTSQGADYYDLFGQRYQGKEAPAAVLDLSWDRMTRNC